MENKTRPRRTNEPGPSGRRVAANLEALRELRHLNQDGLAARLGSLGRPMTRQMVSKSEIADRRIDVDDLLAFAVALDTTPNRLLLTEGAEADQTVDLADGVQVSALDAWRWAAGEQPLDRCWQGEHGDTHQLRFMRESLPHRSDVNADVARRRREITALLARDPELARIVAVVVDEVNRRGIDIDMLLGLIGHVHVNALFGLPPTAPEQEQDGE